MSYCTFHLSNFSSMHIGTKHKPRVYFCITLPQNEALVHIGTLVPPPKLKRSLKISVWRLHSARHLPETRDTAMYLLASPPPPFCIFYLATQRSPSLMGDKLAKLRRLASPGGNQSKLELPKWRKWLVFSALGVQAQGPYADINTKILPSPFMHHRPIVTIAHNLRLSNITEVGRHRSPNIGSSTLKKKSFNIYITHIANS